MDAGRWVHGRVEWEGSGLAGLRGHELTNCLNSTTHSGYFILYATMCFASMVYLFYFFPETKGKTLEEVEVRPAAADDAMG